MSRLALTMAVLFALQGPLCVLHCLAGPAEASAAVPACHVAADAPAGEAPAERPDAPLEHCTDLSEALSPEGSTLDSGAHVIAVLAPIAPGYLARTAPLPRAPLRTEARARLYLATSQLRL